MKTQSCCFSMQNMFCEYWFGSCHWFILSVPVAHNQHRWSAFKVQWHLWHFQKSVHLSFQEGPFDLRHVICGCRAVIYCSLLLLEQWSSLQHLKSIEERSVSPRSPANAFQLSPLLPDPLAGLPEFPSRTPRISHPA